MADVALSALMTVLSGQHILFVLLGVVIGVVVGLLPGLSGVAGMAILLPFIYGMDPVSALGMLVGLVAVVPTGDTFSSVLLGIPGSSASQATVLDGFPLAARGEATRALSAAFFSSLFGGLFGALVLTLAILAARPIILAFSSAELLALTIFGLSMVAVLSGRNLAKGVASACLGMTLSFVGTAPATGDIRMTFGIDYLYDGIPLVVVALGIFAMPEIIDLMRRGKAISSKPLGKGGWFTGLRDVIANKWLVLRSATIGCLVGAMPGLGGAVIDWIAYAHAVQTTKDGKNFGNGEIRGVIAPESANNAGQGGALVPTMIFGIPGSGSTAMFLGGLALLGIQPGITMISRDLDLTYTVIWSLALANVVGALLCVFMGRQVARLTEIPFTYVGPFIICALFFAAYQATRSEGDLVALVLLTILGVYLRRFGWPRPAFLIGFILAKGTEVYLYQAVQFYGFDWVTRPIVLCIFGLTVISAGVAYWRRSGVSTEGDTDPDSPWTRPAQTAFALLVLGGLGYALYETFDYTFLGGITPASIAVIGGLAMLVMFYRVHVRTGFDHDEDAGTAILRGFWTGREKYIGVVAALAVGVYLIGFYPAMAVFLFALFWLVAHAGVLRAAVLATIGLSLFLGISTAMGMRTPSGVLTEAVMNLLN